MTDFPTLCTYLNLWSPCPFIYLKPEKGTPFGWSLPLEPIIGSIPPEKLPLLEIVDGVFRAGHWSPLTSVSWVWVLGSASFMGLVCCLFLFFLWRFSPASLDFLPLKKPSRLLWNSNCIQRQKLYINIASRDISMCFNSKSFLFLFLLLKQHDLVTACWLTSENKSVYNWIQLANYLSIN